MRIFMVSLLLLCLAETANSKTEIKPTEHVPTQDVSLEDTRQIDKLESQFAVIRDYNDDFLSIVIWALSALGALTVVLIGFNWVQSSRVLKNEIKSIKNDLEGSIRDSSRELSERIDEKLAEVDKNLRKVAGEVSEEKISKVRGRIRRLSADVLDLQYESLSADVKRWQKRPVPINAVSVSGNLIDCAISIGYDWKISGAINILNESLDLLKESGDQIGVQELNELEAKVEKIPDSHKTAKAAILKRLEEMHKR
ncbi:hypothetical protein [Thiohalophilus sp.]|uniref:hypothetical protein n=1 Tax=Thiohalophilus sp. TaxID=3028392 RepID=UPI002ACD8771|nr:hypothetical protein [Thiohalophilus sp.]MDZ7662273.1 hypothetical protein [Thiohalophilus sp.]